MNKRLVNAAHIGEITSLSGRIAHVARPPARHRAPEPDKGADANALQLIPSGQIFIETDHIVEVRIALMSLSRESGMPHPAARGIVERMRRQCRRPSLAEDFHLETMVGSGQRCGHIGEGDRLTHAMTVATRRDPANDLTVAPDRLVAVGIGVDRVDRQRHQPPLGTGRALALGGGAADEIALGEIDEAIEPGFAGRVDRPVFARPVAEAFFPRSEFNARAPKCRRPKPAPASTSAA